MRRYDNRPAAEDENVDRVTVSVSVDTEEDNWGSYIDAEVTAENVPRLIELQDLFDRWGARPTYLVNRAPLIDHASVEVLGALASRETVEVGTHCHPWNAPPVTGTGLGRSMMCRLSPADNRAKIRNIHDLIVSELGVHPSAFRAGRWGFGPSVATALVQEGYRIDCSITPFIDWTSVGGPDFTEAPHGPYRFDPREPLVPAADGPLLQLPPTIGFLRGAQSRSARIRRRLESSVLSRHRIVGLLDKAGLFARRWLSPEVSSGRTMIRLARQWIATEQRFLQVTLHSSSLLPGATPFVRDESDKKALLSNLNEFFSYCEASGFRFRTLSEFGHAHDTVETRKRVRSPRLRSDVQN